MPDNGPLTFINVFEIAADQVDGFLPGWHERARIMSTIPGFGGYRMHRAISGDSRFQLVVVGHWDSSEAFHTAIANPEFRAKMQALNEDTNIKFSNEPALYQVVLSDTND